MKLTEKMTLVGLWLSGCELSSGLFLSPKLTVSYDENSGYGIYRDDAIEAGEVLYRIPKSLLINHLTCMKHILRDRESGLMSGSSEYRELKLPRFKSDWHTINVYEKLTEGSLVELTSFQLVSLFLCIEKKRQRNSFWEPFILSLPRRAQLGGIPLLWEVLQLGADSTERSGSSYNNAPGTNSPLTALLPIPVIRRVRSQLKKFENDYEIVVKLLETQCGVPEDFILREEFLVAWLCINSRCLYMELPAVLENKTTEDYFTLCPLVDFVNHCDGSRNNTAFITIEKETFNVVASLENPNYPTPNKELLFSYGSHPNAFLLTEYGFVLANDNKWETIDITEYILEHFLVGDIQFLKKNDYHGDYTLDHEDISYRTTVALSLLTSTNDEKVKDPHQKVTLLINGLIDDTEFEGNTDFLVQILRKFTTKGLQINERLETLTGEDIDYPLKVIRLFYSSQLTLAKTWLQRLETVD